MCAVCVSSLCGCRCFSGSAHLDKYYSSSGGRGGTFLTLTGYRSRNVKHDWESTQEAGESRTAADVPIRVARRAFHTTAHGWHRRLRPLLLDEAARNLENKQQLRAAITTRQGHCNTVVPTAAENRPTLHFTPSQSNRDSLNKEVNYIQNQNSSDVQRTEYFIILLPANVTKADENAPS